MDVGAGTRPALSQFQGHKTRISTNFYAAQECRVTDFETSKLRKGRSRRQIQVSVLRFRKYMGESFRVLLFSRAKECEHESAM